MQTKSRIRKAFTLVELLVVMLILGILAALIVPRLLGHADDAKVSAARTDISEIANALQRFRIDADRFPTDQEGLEPLRTQPSDVSVWHGPYLDLKQDPWHHDYFYKQIDDKNFIVGSYGQDGAEGGDGIAKDITNQDDATTTQ